MGVGSLAKTDGLQTRYGGVTRPAGTLNLHVWAPAFTGFGGGITSFSRELALGLNDVGHTLRLFGLMDSTSKFCDLPLHGTGQYTRVSRSHVFAARTLASAAWRRPDHILSTHVNFGPVAHLAKRSLGIPFTLVAHGIDVHPGLPPATIAAMRAAEGIIAVSTWTRLRVLDLGGIDPALVTILPNTFDEGRFTVAPRPESLAKRYGVREGERVVLTVARLASDERYKGYDRVITALPELLRSFGPVRFILVGEGADRARVEALASELGVRSAVTFAGFVSDAELADHYRLADVFAMPSTGEGFGIVFLEAMGCGTPTVAGNRDGSVDALDRGRLGMLVDPNDVSAITAGIWAVLEKRGPQLWFDRHSLRDEVQRRFGRAEFRRCLKTQLRLPLEG
jgi:glycosyltransferase involved in cell wall biosynthesis